MAIVRRNESTGNVARWDPWYRLPMEFSDMRREFDRMFDRLVGGENLWQSRTANPPVDIIERENEYIVRAEVPGVNPNDVKITLQNDVLTIRGEKTEEKEIEKENYHQSEIMAGTFQRSFALPSSVKSEKIEASSENGILTITIPKAEEAKTREITVKASTPGFSNTKSRMH
jgi:HSP20 family protein